MNLSAFKLALGLLLSLVSLANAADEKLQYSAIRSLDLIAQRDETLGATLMPQFIKIIEDKSKKRFCLPWNKPLNFTRTS